MQKTKFSLTIKVIVLITVLILAASSIEIYFVYNSSYNTVRREIQNTLEIVASNAALTLDGDKLALLKTKADEGNAVYLELQKKLQAVKEASMGKLRYVYTFAKSGDSYIYILDAEPIGDKENHSPIGSVFSMTDYPEAINGFLKPTAEKIITYDKEFKIWSQSGYAPIKDSGGNVIGVLGVDMDISVIKVMEAQMNNAGFEALAASLLFALLIGFLFSQYIIQPIHILTRSARSVAAGNLDVAVSKSIKRNDELGQLATAFDLMTKDLKASKEKIETYNRNLIESNEELTKEIELHKQAQEKIEYLAYFDHLTGLPNRLMLIDRLNLAIDLAKRIIKPLCILFIDLDGFKMVNDTMGHDQGDELLKVIAGRLVSIVRRSDTVARFSGDEFIIMVQNLSKVDQIYKVADKVYSAFKKPFKLNRQEVYMSASIGISIFPTDGETGDELIKNADLAMYTAKDNGKNQYAYCTEIMKERIDENMKLTNGLYRSLERNELEIYYQPQVCLSKKRVVGLEALLRWNHPEFGMILPGRFIHLAEQTGLINPIGEWVLRTVCKQNKTWQEAGLPHIRIAINLSIVQFQNPEIVNQIKSILKETDLSSQHLELEITESIAMRDTDFVIRVLNEFREIGLYISIDDFGTEFSSLKYLKLLPINRIKIPMPFIQGINTHDKDEAITKAIIVLAKNMGMDVIAEGVETQQQESFLKQHMCDEMQGFLYYKPMPANEIEAILCNGLIMF